MTDVQIDDPSDAGEPVIEVRGLEVRFAGRRRLFGGQKEAPSAVTASVGSELGDPATAFEGPLEPEEPAARPGSPVPSTASTSPCTKARSSPSPGSRDAARRRSPGR